VCGPFESCFVYAPPETDTPVIGGASSSSKNLFFTKPGASIKVQIAAIPAALVGSLSRLRRK
jgi:hypothetical protein